MAQVAILSNTHLCPLARCHRGTRGIRCISQSKRTMFYEQRISRCHNRNKVSASSQEVTTEEQGQISSQLMQQMKESITNNLEADKVEVTDVYGDGRHVNIEVVSKLFDGQSSMKRQRLVYKVSNCLEIPPVAAVNFTVLNLLGWAGNSITALESLPNAGNLAGTAKHCPCCGLNEDKHTCRGWRLR